MSVKIVASTCERLNLAVKRKGIRQSDLVKLTGIDKSSISLYLSGKVTPKGEKLYNLALVLDVSPVWLSGFDVPMNKTEQITHENEPKDENVIRIAGRDGSFVEKHLTDEQLKAFQAMVELLPENTDENL